MLAFQSILSQYNHNLLVSAPHVIFVVVDLEEFHDLEESRRKGVGAFLFSYDFQLFAVEFEVLLETHEFAADEDGHVVVAEDDHVADLVGRVVGFHLGSV